MVGSKSFLAAPLLCLFLPLRLRLDSHDLVDPEVVEDIEERLLTLFEPGLPLKRTNNNNVKNRKSVDKFKWVCYDGTRNQVEIKIHHHTKKNFTGIKINLESELEQQNTHIRQNVSYTFTIR